MPLWLKVQVVRSGQQPFDVHFDSDTHRVVKVGKLGSAQVKIDDPKASRVHAIVELSAAHAVLVDMGSTAGTFLNGARINKAVLNTDDIITIGDTSLVVAVTASAPNATLEATAGYSEPSPALVPGPYGYGQPLSPQYAAMPVAAPASSASAYNGQRAPAPSGGSAPRPAAPAVVSSPGPGSVPSAAANFASTDRRERIVASLAGLRDDRLAMVEAYARFLSTYDETAPIRRAASMGRAAAASDNVVDGVDDRDVEAFRRQRLRTYLIAGTVLVIAVVILFLMSRTPAFAPPEPPSPAPTASSAGSTAADPATTGSAGAAESTAVESSDPSVAASRAAAAGAHRAESPPRAASTGTGQGSSASPAPGAQGTSDLPGPEKE